MRKIDISVDFTIDQNEAISRIKKLLNNLKSQYGDMISDVHEKWTLNHSEFSFKAMGMSVEGEITVRETVVQLNGKIPLAAIPFKATIENKIREEAIKLLM